jgi:hypothetical protein
VLCDGIRTLCDPTNARSHPVTLIARCGVTMVFLEKGESATRVEGHRESTTNVVLTASGTHNLLHFREQFVPEI